MDCRVISHTAVFLVTDEQSVSLSNHGIAVRQCGNQLPVQLELQLLTRLQPVTSHSDVYHASSHLIRYLFLVAKSAACPAQVKLAGVKVGWVCLYRMASITLCDPIWQATPLRTYKGFNS